MALAWRRDSYVTGGGAAEVALLALSSAKLPDPLPVSRAHHGMPVDGDGALAVALALRDRAEDPSWFAGQVAAFSELIASDLGPAAEAIARAAEHAYVITAELDDPDDLGHIQAAWALAKCVCEEGAAVVIDVHAMRAHLGSEVAQLAPERAFDVMHEVSVLFAELGDGTLAASSTGLRKFGRPDLVLLGVAPDDAAEAAVVLRDVAATLAAGERIEPGDRVATPGGILTAAPWKPEMAPIVSVQEPAIVLCDWHPGGARAGYSRPTSSAP